MHNQMTLLVSELEPELERSQGDPLTRLPPFMEPIITLSSFLPPSSGPQMRIRTNSVTVQGSSLTANGAKPNALTAGAPPREKASRPPHQDAPKVPRRNQVITASSSIGGLAGVSGRFKLYMHNFLGKLKN
jgi:hypothetical protein